MKRAPTSPGSGWIHSPDDSGPRIAPRVAEPPLEPQPASGDKRRTDSLARPLDERTRTVELTQGTIIANRYQLTRFIGRGAMGVVWEGRHVTVGRTVAVKILPEEWADDKKMGRRFRAEARAASAAGHPNIVEVFDAGELDDGRPFLVMEFLRGLDTRDLLSRDGPFETARACRYVRDAARALHAAHERGVIHRDLKPENIFVIEDSETVKVLDFGIAIQSELAVSRMTSPGVAVGTPEAMAPEQVFGATPTPSFDIYALGVVLFELLTGRPPIWDPDATQILRRKAAEDPPSLTEYCPDAPEVLADLVRRTLARDPEDRPRTANELADALDEIVDTISRGPVAMPPVRRRRLPVVMISAGVLVLAVATVVVFVPQAAPQPASPFTGPLEQAVDGVSRAAVGQDVPVPLPVPVPEPEPVPQPVPVPVPEPAPEPHQVATDDAPPVVPQHGPRARQRSQPAKPLARSKPTPPAATATCSDRRTRALDARQVHDWAGVIRYTSPSSCWEVAIDRTRLRVQALMELGRFEHCVVEARGIADAKVGRWRRICERRREEP